MSATARVNLNELSPSEKQQLIERIYHEKSYFQHLFNTDRLEFQCETISIQLRNEINRILLDKEIIIEPIALENLHEVLSDEMKTYNFNDGVNKISTYFYDNDEIFQKSYLQFIVYLRTHFLHEPFWFQQTPTIRIHCPNGKNNHHYPRYHSDISYGHPPEEINIWLPLTDLLSGHGFRTMSLATSKSILQQFDYDFASFIHSAIHDKEFSKECEQRADPVTTKMGHFFTFDSRCIHSGEPLSQHTRVSIDIRILPLSQYEKMQIEYQGSGRRKILFAPGHCYHQHDSDYFLNKGI